MYEFKPKSWDEVQAYDTVVVNVERVVGEKPRLRRMVLTYAPRVHRDAFAVEHDIVTLTGKYVTKDGKRNKAYHDRWDHFFTARLNMVVAVQRSGDAPAGTTEAPAVVEATPAPVKPLTPPMEEAMTIARHSGYVYASNLRRNGVGTIVALMRRGLLREADPHRHGRHYLATTPAQVWDEAHAEVDARERFAVEAVALVDAELASEAPEPLRPHPFLPTMGNGPAYGLCQMRRCGLPYADDIHRTGIDVGDTVQRHGEVGPDCPVGIVTQVEAGWAHAYVAFSGLVPCRVRLSTLVKVSKAEPVAVRALAATFGGTIREPADALPTPVKAETTFADDITALRRLIHDGPARATRRAMREHLDRIAAQMPQRATATEDALPLWLHITCGGTFASHSVPKLTICRKCDQLTGEADWRALYTLGHAAAGDR
jgi:hypothetical protein